VGLAGLQAASRRTAVTAPRLVAKRRKNYLRESLVGLDMGLPLIWRANLLENLSGKQETTFYIQKTTGFYYKKVKFPYFRIDTEHKLIGELMQGPGFFAGIPEKLLEMSLKWVLTNRCYHVILVISSI
jgi:hypothetical protein